MYFKSLQFVTLHVFLQQSLGKTAFQSPTRFNFDFWITITHFTFVSHTHKSEVDTLWAGFKINQNLTNYRLLTIKEEKP